MAKPTYEELTSALKALVDSYDIVMTVMPAGSIPRGVVSGAFQDSPDKARILLDRIKK